MEEKYKRPEKLHHHFQSNIDAWLKNPHIRSAHTCLNEKKEDWEVCLCADDVNHESVVALKKAIEQEGHKVTLIHQQYTLEHETINHGQPVFTPVEKKAETWTAGVTVKDKKGHTYLLTTGHAGKVGAQLFTSYGMKPPHFATITQQTPVGGQLDSALASLEDQKNLSPKKFLITDPVSVVDINDKVGTPVMSLNVVFRGQSGFHHAEIVATDWSGKVGNAEYKNCVKAKMLAGSTITQPNDSGAAYFGYHSNALYLVGLHLTGNKDANDAWSVCVPIGPNIEHFGLEEECLALE
eukprot:Phypoly_transcript_09841.p1 GENE.Phypoly_transcript_09841~~Phypoly_transcript_09841.p1  ORF type:complete len:295 (+),score=40.93 Phypoly_transcript_09841:352-1236(+)